MWAFLLQFATCIASLTALSGPELAKLMTIDTRVVRGSDWKWGDQDGGIGGIGTVIRGVMNGYVRVHWDAGVTNSYRMGHDEKYDLDLTAVTSLSGPELAKLMTIDTRVVRGRDWDWGDQDGGVGGVGTVIRGVLDGYVRVHWDAGAINSYRMGHDRKYDLDLVSKATVSTSSVSIPVSTGPTEPETTTAQVTEITRPNVTGLSGPELVKLMTIDTRVVRGRDWEWGDQDGGVGGVGTIIRGVLDGYVRVHWDAGTINSYRMGNDGKYDLDLVSKPTVLTTNDSILVNRSMEPETTTAKLTGITILNVTGPELAKLMTIDTRVVRGRDWKWGDQDGGIGHVGTVTRGVLNGWVRVQWDVGTMNSYRMGHGGKYDLELYNDLSTTNNWTNTFDTGSTTSSSIPSTSSTSQNYEEPPKTTQWPMASTTPSTIPWTTTANTEEPSSSETAKVGCTEPTLSPFTCPNVKESNKIFVSLVENAMLNVPATDRIQLMQDILELFKKFNMVC